MIGWYRVKYERLYDENGNRITEVVPEKVMQWKPPAQRQVRAFEVGEHVDVWEKEGWWYRVVIQQLDGMYEIDFSDFGRPSAIVVESLIRRHMTFYEGRWVYPPR